MKTYRTRFVYKDMLDFNALLAYFVLDIFFDIKMKLRISFPDEN